MYFCKKKIQGISVGQLKRERSRGLRSILRHDSDGKAMLDGLGVRVGFGELLRGTFEVRPRLFHIILQLGVIPVQLLVVIKRRVL